MAYDNTNSGALFKNEDKAEPNQPDYKGSLNVGGKDFWIAAWLKTSKAGKKFMSLSVQSKDKKERAAQGKSKSEVDEDVPF